MAERTVFAEGLTNLADPELGAAVIAVTDEFFAPAKRMLNKADPVFQPGLFDEHGKWMDGWESRRKRAPGHDSCVLRICPGTIRGVDVDTRHFTGNHPPAASLEACNSDMDPGAPTEWTELVPVSELSGDSQHFFKVEDPRRWTHVRLNIYPDGGIARLRVFGEAAEAEPEDTEHELADLSSAAAGGRALQCNNMHFGHMRNLLSNEPVANMGDGWETRRRREPGNDWVIVKLGRPGRIVRAEVDTAFFRGNHPARCALSGTVMKEGAELSGASGYWREILPELALGPDQLHIFESQVRDAGNVTHVRLDIYPDGGIARLRLLGIPADSGDRD